MLLGMTAEPADTALMVSTFPDILYMRDFGRKDASGRSGALLTPPGEGKWQHLPPGAVMHASWKGNPEDVTPWLDALARPAYITYWHEPMGDIAPVEYRARATRMAALIAGHPNRAMVLGHGPIVTRYWLDHGGNPDDFWYDGATFFGVDPYNGQNMTRYRTAEEMYGRAVLYATSRGVPWIVPELGAEDIGPGRDDAMAEWARWADQEGNCLAVGWWGIGGNRIIGYPAETAVWRELTAEQKGDGMIPWLADVLRADGLTVVEHAGWETRMVRDSNGDPLTWAPRFGVVHATAAPATQADSVQVAIVRDGREGLPGPIANACVDRQGRWHVLAAGRCNTTLAGTAGPYEGLGNRYALGIEACNDNVSEPWPAVQYESYHRGWAAICRRLGWTASNLVGHKEHTPGHKTDPTFSMGEFRADVTQSLEGEPEMQLSDTLTDNSGQFHGVSINQTLVWLLKWTNSVANGLGLAARLDAILAAALDDGDTTVILDDTALTTVREVRDAVAALGADVAALPAAVAGEHAARLAQ